MRRGKRGMALQLRREVELSAVVIRKDGTREDRGVIASTRDGTITTDEVSSRVVRILPRKGG